MTRALRLLTREIGMQAWHPDAIKDDGVESLP
jgi:hypothetical protein